MDIYTSVTMAPKDPILGLTDLFLQDKRPSKVNLSIGAYVDEYLNPWVLPSVLLAEQQLLGKAPKSYLPMQGDQEFTSSLHNLLGLPQESAGIHTLGGTGALHLFGLLARNFTNKIYIPNYTWGNHRKIFSQAGCEVESYPYYDRAGGVLDTNRLLQFLDQPLEGPCLFHACCHNPTGIDPSESLWKEILLLLRKYQHFVIFDMAYHGFGKGLQDDLFVIKQCIHHQIPCAIAYTCSKNFGLYGERVGALFFLGCHNKTLEVQSQLCFLARGIYSSPNRHGAAIVKTILQDSTLTQKWSTELVHMRTRIQAMRHLLHQGLQTILQPHEIEAFGIEEGMFSLLPLNPTEVSALMHDYGIYLTSDGRINLAGLNDENVCYVYDAIIEVKKRAC